MDAHAVLVFHNQHLTDEQHLTFSRSLGQLEEAAGSSLREADDFRLPTTFADVSNLDKNQQVLALDDRRRLFAIGNRLWHSDSSFKVVPARTRCCVLWQFRPRAAIRNMPTCAPLTMRWTLRPGPSPKI